MSDQTPDYRDTLFLPQTDFPMRAGLPKREPDWLARWEAMDLYGRMQETAAGRPRFELHDGPPYANGHLHIGHALNKILKDFVTRSRWMSGYDARYRPGWDCHGLPIEWKIEEQYRARGRDKDAAPINELRGECRKFAGEWIDVQRAEFKRLGVVGDWSDPYLTMTYDAEAAIAGEFHKFVMNGALYRGSMPVMWSVVEKTALAEAEVEYHDHQSHTIWVKFPIVAGPELFTKTRTDVVIWTTTPWTIPQNRAVCFGPEISYGLYEVIGRPEECWASIGDRFVMADALAEQSFAQGRLEGPEMIRRLCDVTQDDLAAMTLAHPLRGAAENGEWDFDAPMLPGGHVTEEAGTGFVHTAPSHGADDYAIGVKHGLPMTYNVLEDGSFREDLPLFGGAVIFTPKGKEGDANKRVIDKLVEIGALLARGRVKHSYPHSWRSKAPLIFRNAPQWFIGVDRKLGDGMDAHGETIRERALASIDGLVTFHPKTGQNRLRTMIANRPDWVVSRQRAWGVPLSCFVNAEGELLRDAAVNARILDAFRAEGSDAWFAGGAKERFLGADHDPDAWEKVDDILDVWFDSGSTHVFAMKAQGRPWPADVYLEGSDQHRGWFQSSMLEGCGAWGRAPYKTVVTHGFTLDEKGEKMAKSVGNTVAPDEVVKQYGADILRLWVATTDYTDDQRIGPNILKGVADSYRRLRNGLRFLLANLDGFEEAERVAPEQMPELERWVLHRLAEVDAEIRRAYDGFAWQKAWTTLFNFVTTDLSAVYFDIRKDSLYCDAADDPARRACRTVLDLLFHRLTSWLAPILAFTAEEVWLARFPGKGASVHLQTFPDTPPDWRDEALGARMAQLFTLRRVALGALEVERREKRIGAALEAAPVLHVSDPALRAAAEGVDLAELLITSGATITDAPAPEGAFILPDVAGVAVVPARAAGRKCARCWRVAPDVGAHRHAMTCARCDSVLG